MLFNCYLITTCKRGGGQNVILVEYKVILLPLVHVIANSEKVLPLPINLTSYKRAV